MHAEFFTALQTLFVEQVGTSGTGTSSIVGIELVPDKEKPPAWVYDLSHGTRRGLFSPLLVPVGQVWYR